MTRMTREQEAGFVERFRGAGVTIVTPDVAAKYNLAVQKGVIVESVTSDSGADKAAELANK